MTNLTPKQTTCTQPLTKSGYFFLSKIGVIIPFFWFAFQRSIPPTISNPPKINFLSIVFYFSFNILVFSDDPLELPK